MKFDFEKFKKTMPSKSSTGKAIGSLSETQCEEVLKEIKQTLKINDTDPAEMETTMALVSGLMQNGGSNRNAGPNVSYTLAGYTLSAADFQKFCRKKTSGGTARQFARTMANEIAKFAAILDEEGDLARQMRLDDPLLPRDLAVWCSNFQSENSQCPQIVRDWLVQKKKADSSHNTKYTKSHRRKVKNDISEDEKLKDRKRKRKKYRRRKQYVKKKLRKSTSRTSYGQREKK